MTHSASPEEFTDPIRLAWLIKYTSERFRPGLRMTFPLGALGFL
jgi:hypothetical protein